MKKKQKKFVAKQLNITVTFVFLMIFVVMKQKRKKQMSEEQKKPFIKYWYPSKTQSVSFYCPGCKAYVSRSRITGKCPYCEEKDKEKQSK